MRSHLICARWWLGIVLICTAAAVAAGETPPRLPQARPEEVGMSAARLAEIDRLVAEQLHDGKLPGCVVLVARQGKIVLRKAYGSRQVQPQPVAMTVDTVFDLASLTKPTATATSIMILRDQGKLRLEQPVAAYLPEFAANGKDAVTIEHLLTHQGGLVADNSLADYADGPEKAWQNIFALRPKTPPGTNFVYSDMGLIVLGEVVHRVSGQTLDVFAREAIYAPLGMTDTGFLPKPELRRRAAPTEQRHGAWMQGEVHDPRSYALGGVAGHAGLFSTADDLVVYAQMLLGQGEYQGVRVLSSQAVADMITPRRVSKGLRGLGWDMTSSYSSNRSPKYSPAAFGHGGFTGTGMWIDPAEQLVVIFLSNRVHPDGKGLVNPLIGQIGTAVVEAIGANASIAASGEANDSAKGDRSMFSADVNAPKTSVDRKMDQSPERAQSPRRASVLTGIDVLEREGFASLQGRRVGLITNHTGLSRHGVATGKLLHEAKGVTLVALFSPEHGIEGKLDQANITNSRDPATGVPIFSLYGKTRRPTEEMLKGIDTLVFDIQDIGARFYTYISTMGNAMEAAAARRLRFVVLDRPNPINGVDVAGPLCDAGRETFVAYHRLPVRHGMTVGELATMFKAQRRLELDLQVVRMEGWQRQYFFDDTDLRWIGPSPNMRTMTEALLYPGVGLLETTNVSVGRGTPKPFEILGAPWLDGKKLAAELNAAAVPGVRFEPAVFTPESSVFHDQRCEGVTITITDRRLFEPLRTGLQIAVRLRASYPKLWKAEAYDRLLANRAALQALLAGKTAAEIAAGWQDELQAFQQQRARFLLY